MVALLDLVDLRPKIRIISESDAGSFVYCEGWFDFRTKSFFFKNFLLLCFWIADFLEKTGVLLQFDLSVLLQLSEQNNLLKICF